MKKNWNQVFEYPISFIAFQELKAEVANLKESSKKSLNVKDKQIEQLVDGFQKQMQLIDVLRRQKVYLTFVDKNRGIVSFFE